MTTKYAPPSHEFGITPQRRSIPMRILAANTFWIGLVLLALFVIFSVMEPKAFLSAFNLRQLAIESAVLLVLAVGMTFVIITGGIDLSVGSVLIFASMVSAKAMNAMAGGSAVSSGWDVIAVGFIVALAGGAIWGLINGWLIAVAGIPPLIVTLGTLGAALGAAQLINDGSDISGIPAKLNRTFGFGRLFGVIPNLVIVATVITIAAAWLLHTTRFGRYTFAVGSNAEAVRRAGINVTGHLMRVYLLTGFLAGAAGFMSLAYANKTAIGAHSLDNLNAIAAVVMGGTSLFGGIGSMLGTVIGVFIPAVLKKGFNIVGVQDFWQSIAVGAVLIAAVWFDQQRRRSRNQL
jgi:ribose transport system permease protein